MTTVLFYIALVLIFLAAWLMLPQFLTKRAAKKVVKIFRVHNALDVNSARSAAEMGLAAKPFFSLARFGTRDWKPKALQLLLEVGVIQVTPDNRLYLVEEKLQNTTLVRKR